jgi:hypothetical protein
MRRYAIALLIAVVVLVPAPSAMADHHLMKVNELMLSSGGNQAAQLVELRDDFDEPFPAALEPYKVVVYDGGGTKVGAQDLSPNPFPSRNNTEPYLLASDAAGLGAERDAALTVALPQGAGHVCFTRLASEARVHCVAYGCPASPLAGSQVGRAPGDGESLQRLGSGLVIGAPTPNAANAAGTSAACPGSTPPPGGGGRTTPPGGGGRTTPPGGGTRTPPSGGGGGTTSPGGGTTSPGGGGGAPVGGGEVRSGRGAPVQRLSGRLRQDVDRLAVAVRLNEAATIVVKATVHVPGAARIVRFKTVRRRVAAGVRVSVRLRLPTLALRSVKGALGRRARLTARIAVTARDSGGFSRKVRLVRLTD